MKIVVVGSAHRDTVCRVPRLPDDGETVIADSVERHAGGKGNNQAVAAARAGASVVFIAAVGADASGDVLEDELRRAGVDARLRRVAEPTGGAYITVDETGENTIVVDTGANALLTRLSAAEREAIASADFLMLQLESPPDTVVEAAGLAHGAGATVILNAAPIRPLPAGLASCVDVLIVNRHEAIALVRALTGTHRPDSALSVDAAHDVALALRSAFPAVIVTLGSDGAIVLTEEMGAAPAAHVPAHRIVPVDATGAGDTFCGALVAALARGAELVAAVRFATAAAALCVQRPGAVASIPSRADIDAFRAGERQRATGGPSAHRARD